MQAYSSSIEPVKYKYNVLAVDDDRSVLLLLGTQLEEMGHNVITARNGREALNILKSPGSIDIMLLDREMPEVNGLEVVACMKNNPQWANIPIIMQTGYGKPEEIKEGIDLGVFYYLTKPLTQEVLQSVVSAAIREVEQRKNLISELEKHRGSFGLIEDCRFSFSKLSEAERLASFLANLYPNPERILMGLAELLINAVEHGNLRVDYSEKSRLMAMGTWRNEILRREALPENKDKKVNVCFARRKDGLYLNIADEGPGFDWRPYMKIDPSRISDSHGRGIALANMISFDEISYNDTGNEVTAFADLNTMAEA